MGAILKYEREDVVVLALLRYFRYQENPNCNANSA